MAGLVPAIHALSHRTKNVDARDKPGHDGELGPNHPFTLIPTPAVDTVPRDSTPRESPI
ncbi:hypothetical protein ACVWZV_008222 [Bradyrhizobium sp. GM5.1]